MQFLIVQMVGLKKIPPTSATIFSFNEGHIRKDRDFGVLFSTKVDYQK